MKKGCKPPVIPGSHSGEQSKRLHYPERLRVLEQGGSKRAPQPLPTWGPNMGWKQQGYTTLALSRSPKQACKRGETRFEKLVKNEAENKSIQMNLRLLNFTTDPLEFWTPISPYCILCTACCCGGDWPGPCCAEAADGASIIGDHNPWIP